MFTVDPEIVISEILEAAFGLKTYIEIMDYAGHDGFAVKELDYLLWGKR